MRVELYSIFNDQLNMFVKGLLLWVTVQRTILPDEQS